MSERARVELEVGESGLGSLRVNGLELAPIVARAVITIAAGHVPRIEVDITPGSVRVNTMGELELIEDPRT